MGDLIRGIIRWIIVILIILLIVFLIIKITNKNSVKKDVDNGIKTLKTITTNDSVNSNTKDENQSIIPGNNTTTVTNDNNTVTVNNTATSSYIGVIGFVILFAGGVYIIKSRKRIEEAQ